MNENFLPELAAQFGVPKYLTTLLELSGYSSEIALKTVIKRNPDELKQYLLEYGKLILSDNFEYQKLKENFQSECTQFYINCNPEKFRVPPGHVDFLIGIFESTNSSPLILTTNCEQKVTSNSSLIYSSPLKITNIRNYSDETEEISIKRKHDEFIDETEIDEDKNHMEAYEEIETYSEPNNSCSQVEKKMKMLTPLKSGEFIEYVSPGKKNVQHSSYSYFTDANKRRLVLLLKKCWPREIDPPEFFMIEEVGPKCWTIQCPCCENYLKIFLNTAGGYLRFNKANFQRHLSLHVTKGIHLNDDSHIVQNENQENLE